MKYKGIIYTIVTGGYDHIRPPLFKNEDWYYILLTDRPPPPEGDGREAFDRVLIIEYTTFEKPDGTIIDLTGVQNQRMFKILMNQIAAEVFQVSEPDHHFKIIYHDGKLQQNADITELADLLTDDIDLVVKKHPDRHCIYKEAVEVMNRGLADKRIVTEQMDKYETPAWSIPRNVGLVDSCILIRWAKQTDYQKDFYQKWWEEVITHSHRDQLSFNAVLWHHPLRIQYFTDYLPFFDKFSHLK